VCDADNVTAIKLTVYKNCNLYFFLLCKYLVYLTKLNNQQHNCRLLIYCLAVWSISEWCKRFPEVDKMLYLVVYRTHSWKIANDSYSHELFVIYFGFMDFSFPRRFVPNTHWTNHSVDDLFLGRFILWTFHSTGDKDVTWILLGLCPLLGLSMRCINLWRRNI